LLTTLLILGLLGPCMALAADQPQWGQWWSRNMVAEEEDLPARFDPRKKENIKWAVPLGSKSYGTPIVAQGKVFVGTNNSRPRDPKHRGDRGILLCLNESDGSLDWQLVVPKLRVPMADVGGVGLCSPPTIEDDRVYVLTNRGEVLCLDIRGQRDGNAGPFRDEARYMAPKGQPPVSPGPTDADIIWRCDLVAEVGTRLHDAAHCSVLVHGRFVYCGTCNGVDETHFRLPKPTAPGLVAVDKETGRLVATDNASIGPQLIHAMWSSPALGTVDGRELLFFGGGDGVCYAFQPLAQIPPPGERAALKTVWRFHCDPEGRKDVPLDFQDNRTEGPSVISGIPVFHNGRVYVTAGGDVWHGKREAWLKCIDPTQTGEVTETAEVWSYTLQRHCMATPAIHDGLVYITDLGRNIHCVDAKTGRAVWVQETGGQIWGSPLVADGKVYVGTMRGRVWVLRAGREKDLLAAVFLDRPIPTSPVAANGTLYVATMRTLYAIARTGD
jgi:outer membrane protein assembly factor BamB